MKANNAVRLLISMAILTVLAGGILSVSYILMNDAAPSFDGSLIPVVYAFGAKDVKESDDSSVLGFCEAKKALAKQNYDKIIVPCSNNPGQFCEVDASLAKYNYDKVTV